MKKVFLLIVLVISITSVFSQTLFTYGNNSVTKDEFLRAYNKNKTAVADKNQALRDYLDLYIRFKLKVKAAQEMHLDTLASLANDLQNFRSQIEDGYLNDEGEVNLLVKEAFDRSQKDIHIAYIFIPFTTASDTLKIYNTAQSVFKEVHAKPNAMADEVQKLQSQNIAAATADAGFITAFSLPYQFENIVYTLKPGEVSAPYHAKNGYYIFKNIEQRKAVGKWKAAQILITIPAVPSDEERSRAKKLSDSIYTALRNGADFNEIAKKFSDDKMTYMNGGVMPEFGTGKYDPVFESKVYGLQKDGDFTAPFQTEFGYHIVKRISTTPIPENINDANYSYTLKQQVQQDERISSAKEKFVNDISKKLGFKKNIAVNEKDLWLITDSFLVSNNKRSVGSLNENTVLFSFNNNKSLKVKDWLSFARDYKVSSGLYKGESDKELMQKFISISILDNYRKRLQDYNADFRYQMQEFKDGNMLFEVMERNVWTKASSDSAGLVNYYNQHKNKYIWNESADAILITSATEKIADDAAAQIKKGKDWKKVIAENSAQIQSDSGRYELTQIPVKSKVTFTEGMVTEPLVNAGDGTASFVKILKVYPANQQRNFDEARGLVINDYQNFLEEKWIEQLKKKYPVKVDEKVFQSMLN